MFYPCSTLRLQTWSVPRVVLAIGLGSDSALQRWRTQTLSGLPVPILQTCLQLCSLHWPQQPYLRILRDSDDTRRGWDPGPLPRCLRDDAGGPGPPSGPGLPSGPGHQTRGNPRDLGPSRHLPQLMRAHHPSLHQPRGSGVPCSPVTQFRGT